MKDSYPITLIRDVEWCLFAGKIAVGLDMANIYGILTLDGDYTSIELKKATMIKISPFGDKMAIAYPNRLTILDTERMENVLEIKTERITTMSWAPYGDYLAFCTDHSCSIYSNLTESVVIGKPIEGVRWSWWSPHTLSLYLQTERATRVIYFDPQMVRSKNVAVRLPTYLRNVA
jgi:hypothetical protein